MTPSDVYTLMPLVHHLMPVFLQEPAHWWPLSHFFPTSPQQTEGFDWIPNQIMSTLCSETSDGVSFHSVQNSESNLNSDLYDPTQMGPIAPQSTHTHPF